MPKVNLKLRSLVRQVQEIEDLKREDRHEIIWAILNGEKDWCNDYWRIVRDDHVTDALAEDIGSNTYVLGCYSPWLLADATGIPIEVFEKLQEYEAFETAGAAAEPHVKKIAAHIQSEEGPAPLAIHDGNYWEVLYEDELFFVMRIN